MKLWQKLRYFLNSAKPNKVNPRVPSVTAKSKRRQASLSFQVTQLGPRYFKVSSNQFLSITGVGITPEQALDQMLDNINNQFEELARHALVASMYRDDIKKKYGKLINRIQNQKRTTNFRKKISRAAQRLMRKLNLAKPFSFLVNIYLREPLKADSLLDKIAESRQNDIFPGNKPMIQPPLMNSASMVIHQENQPIFLKKTPIHKDLPIHLFIDEEGNHLDDTFPFGIVVNLN